MSGNGWYGVDLDGTLAHYEGWDGGKIGAPIPAMADRVKQWLDEGKDVRIFTARVAVKTETVEELEAIIRPIEAWCVEHIGKILPITFAKDFQMIELWDDRCVQVITNTGQTLAEFYESVGEESHK